MDYKADPFLAKALETPPKPPKCRIGTLIEEHPNGEVIAEAVDNAGWPAAALARVLSGRLGGTPIKDDTIRAHRNHTCRCPK